jgi:hypothetical protein
MANTDTPIGIDEAVAALRDEVASLREMVNSLRDEVKAVSTFIAILWKTNGPSGDFRFYFPQRRFSKASEVEAYVKAKVPTTTSFTAATEDGRLVGYAFFTCSEPLDAVDLGKVEWSRSGQHDVIM